MSSAGRQSADGSGVDAQGVQAFLPVTGALLIELPSLSTDHFHNHQNIKDDDGSDLLVVDFRKAINSQAEALCLGRYGNGANKGDPASPNASPAEGRQGYKAQWRHAFRPQNTFPEAVEKTCSEKMIIK